MIRRLGAEFLGTAILVATVVGSGITGALLTDDLAVILLINAGATVAVLGVLIWGIGPISGAQFNPAVTAVAVIRREMRLAEGAGYLLAQVAGGIAGAILANLMFALPPIESSATVRTGWNIWLGEIVATAGLLLLIGALTRTGRGHLGALLVPAWIGAAYFFTSSTSFANPAVTIGRSLTDSFAGIAPTSVLPFIAFQLIGAAIGALLTEAFYPRRSTAPEPLDLPDPVHGPGRPTAKWAKPSSLPCMDPVDADAFRALFRAVPSAVGIVAIRSGERTHATTVSSFCSLSLDPPLLMLALHQDSTVLGLIRDYRSFGLSVLAHHQEALARACAEKGPGSLGDEHWDAQAPYPRIVGATAWAGCELDQVIPGGDHQIVIARIVDTHVHGDPPMVHHARTFRRLLGD